MCFCFPHCDTLESIPSEIPEKFVKRYPKKSWKDEKIFKEMNGFHKGLQMFAEKLMKNNFMNRGESHNSTVSLEELP